MENRKCFTCQVEKPLSDFTPNNRKYQIKKYKGMLLNCDECILDSAVKRKGCVHFNFETNKFEVHNFETDEEMLLFYDDKLSKFKIMEINLGGCIYNYDNKDNKYTLYYSHNDSWREDLKGKKAFEIEDFGNGIGINPKLISKKTLDYSEASELFFLLSKYYENER